MSHYWCVSASVVELVWGGSANIGAALINLLLGVHPCGIWLYKAYRGYQLIGKLNNFDISGIFAAKFGRDVGLMWEQRSQIVIKFPSKRWQCFMIYNNLEE